MQILEPLRENVKEREMFEESAGKELREEQLKKLDEFMRQGLEVKLAPKIASKRRAMEGPFLIRVRYCSDKRDFKKKYNPDNRVLFSIRSMTDLEKEMYEAGMLDGNNWFYTDASKNKTVQFKACYTEKSAPPEYKNLEMSDLETLIPFFAKDKESLITKNDQEEKRERIF